MVERCWFWRIERALKLCIPVTGRSMKVKFYFFMSVTLPAVSAYMIFVRLLLLQSQSTVVNRHQKLPGANFFKKMWSLLENFVAKLNLEPEA